MASSSSSPSTPAFSSQSWKYDVFLSFRGEDTRKTFVDHLYSALETQGIHTYKDDETLPRGESIGPSLMKAIEESQIAVIIFSENYADSSWCLDELACIMTCKDTRGQVVMPIFYDVDPSVVRKQKRKYGEAFSKHELENKTKVGSWRKALFDASNLSGWEPKNIANGHEAKGIKQIVVEISQKLQPGTSSLNENLIGMAARMKLLKSELRMGSGGVHMVGIWGVGGGGKTTLASAIYDEISNKFDGCCFVDNIREESNRHGLGELQEKILSKMDVNRVGGGRHLINKTFRHRKVLIVLDDVDRLDQLKVLAGTHDWFGDGSRIIITTRDKHVLIAHKVNVIHNMGLLDSDEAMMLFCKHAPQDDRPVEDYEQLSREVVSYAGGLPLALTVLGSFLCDKDINEWKSALARLKEIPDTDILEKLKISFDGLKPVEQELFLDIACFFRRETKDETMRIFDACGFHPVIGVKVLIQKALITVSKYGEFDMHDLVQEMAHYIVRGEHPNNPEKHSRIWKEEDVLKICAMDVTTELDMIEAIRFECPAEDNPLRHLPPIVANTKNLRWIEWEGDFASHLLSNFPQKTLCHLLLRNSVQQQLWEGYKWLPNLKTMELFCMENLIITPDFDGLPNLERLTIFKSLYLEEIHPSIGRLHKLVLLFIESCKSLKMFPPITELKKLETFSIRGCNKFFKLSEIQQKMENLPQLHLENSGSEVASYVESSTNFFVICWRCGCSNLPGLDCCLQEPCLRHNSMNIGLHYLIKDLRNLDIGYCSLGDKEMGSAVWELPNLRTLDLSGNDFSRLNISLLRLPHLKLLDVSYCRHLVELSGLPSSMAMVNADGCCSLESFRDIINCKWLWQVSLPANKYFTDVLLDSMLQGNASEDYFINIILRQFIPKRFVGRMYRSRASTLRLPDDWYNDFCGFLICIAATQSRDMYVNILINQKADKISLSELWQESNKKFQLKYVGTRIHVGYVSFGSLRHTASSNSSYTMISVSLEVESWGSFDGETYVGVELVPRKNKGDEPQTKKVPTDSSEYWDEIWYEDPGYNRRPPFTIEHDSKSSIKIKWEPNRF